MDSFATANLPYTAPPSVHTLGYLAEMRRLSGLLFGLGSTP